jgi:peptidoglycan/LPS O-acetylase OafA/YrhL
MVKINTPPNQSKLIGIELVRFMAAISVLIWHYQMFTYIGETPTNFFRDQQPFYSILKIFYEYGGYGVTIFWYISGYIFFWKYGDLISKRLITAKQFFILRISRLYPLHFLTLLLVATLQFLYFRAHQYYFTYPYNDIKHFILHIFFASYWGLQEGFSFNNPIWSVSVEVLIYFIFFITLFLIKNKIIGNILTVLTSLIFLYLRLKSPIISCLGYFYLGGLMAIIMEKISKYPNVNNIFKNISILMLIAPPLLVYFLNLKHFAFMFLVSYSPAILFYLSSIDLSRNMTKKIEILGNLTYSSYLIHFPIQLFIALLFSYANLTIPFYSPTFFLSFLIASLIAAYFIYEYFEKPMQNRLRKKFLKPA